MKDAFPGVEVDLIRGGGGDYIIIAAGQEIWNKRAMGDAFPEEDAIVQAIETIRAG